MKWLRKSLAVAAISTSFANCSYSQSTLSANSGINSADTWVVATLTVNENGTITLPSPAYDPQTQTTTATWPVPSTASYTMEAGYDVNGGLVVNLYPINPNPGQPQSIGPQVSAIRYAGGQLSVFDLQGNQLPMTTPDPTVAIPTPLSFLGTNPGASVIGGLVLANDQVHIRDYASAVNGNVSYPQGYGAALSIPAAQNNPVSAQVMYQTQSVNSNSYLVAQSVTLTTPLSAGTSVRTLSFSNVTWNDNASNDNARANIASTVAAAPAQSNFNASSYVWPAQSTAPTLTTGIIAPTDCNYQTYQLGGPQNVAFAHGWTADACTWIRMTNWLNQDFRFGTEVLANTDGTAADATEGNTLINQLGESGGSGYVLIGHSNGGLVSRYAAQYFQNSNQSVMIPYVATIDTPHGGANITVAAPVSVGVVGAGLLAACAVFDAGCLAGTLMVDGSIVATDLINSGGDALADMVPGSDFLQGLDSTTEDFGRAGVIGHANRRWSFVRFFRQVIIGNEWKSGSDGPYPQTTEPCNPESSCGERAYVNAAEVFYDSLLVATAVDFIVGFFDPGAWALEPYLLGSIFLMDAADAVWNLWTDFPGDGTSDALVSGSSQSYPGAGAVNYIIEGADSHSGALRSSYDHSVLDTILANQFHIPTQAACTFTLPAASLVAPGPGTSTGVNVSSASGCLWSATSQVPWITITSGINGNTNGTVELSIASNPSFSGRTGTIQVGNGNSSTTYQINQYGACTYALSPGATVAVPSTGVTAATTNVVAGPDCVWSAVSSSSWLTVTANGTGSGNGSFTWSASPNPGSVGRTGYIQVAGLTFTVIDGNTVGTAGTGSVTISGTEGNFTINTCYSIHGAPPCPVSMPQTGTVSVTVAGDTYSVHYPIAGGPGATTASAIAAALAGQMNYPESPIVASASGSVITIVSSVPGALTDYPLAASYQVMEPPCTPQNECTPSPAFTGASSGSQLTGGTD